MTIAIGGNGLKVAATRTAFKALRITKKYSPEILTTVGIAGFVATVIVGARATLKVEPLVDRLRDDLADIKDTEGTLEEDVIRKDRIRVYTRAVVGISKNYAPTVGLGVASAVCIVSAHGILRRRNVALVAAYQVLEKSFSSYRERVVEEYGEEKDREFKTGLRTESTKDGNKTVQVTTVDADRIKDASPYGRWFDQVNSTEWNRLPEYNLVFLRAQQAFANQKLMLQGHLFLNDVYESLGIEKSQAGQVVGWFIDKKNPRNNEGDCYVDFGIYDFSNEAGRRFINGSAPGIFLDFNVDGVIIDKI